ncbi:hypothetical protein EZV62_002736 [Acer yangbiense]|uniref:Uncharacterized protein n=1 Tax=Acer yangbiense TaxID=1000413 RepID=A0A5C7IXY6_9ROSI|nr:hypothetical protein EZV62_002736 [Acer yangbiense]
MAVDHPELKPAVIDIGANEIAYIFRVLPFGNRIKRRVPITTDSAAAMQYSSDGHQIIFQQLSSPGLITVSFTLPGPVDPHMAKLAFCSDGILEVVDLQHELAYKNSDLFRVLLPGIRRSETRKRTNSRKTKAQALFFSLESSSLSACSTYSICSSTPHFLSKNSTFNHLTLSFKPLKPPKLLHFHLKPISSHNNRWSIRRTTALVTGGTRGIGRAIVEELVGFGAKVHTCSRNETELNECLENWVGSGFEVTGSVCDVSVRAQREQFIGTLSSLFDNKLDILINNVGINIRKPMVDFTAEELSTLLATNFESVFHLCQLAYPLLKASGAGRIVFTSIVSGFVLLKNMSVQGSTKGNFHV